MASVVAEEAHAEEDGIPSDEEVTVEGLVCETCGELIADPELGCLVCAEEYPIEECVDSCCMEESCGSYGGGGCAGGGFGWAGLAGLAGLAGIGGDSKKKGHGDKPASPCSYKKAVW